MEVDDGVYRRRKRRRKRKEKIRKKKGKDRDPFQEERDGKVCRQV